MEHEHNLTLLIEEGVDLEEIVAAGSVCQICGDVFKIPPSFASAPSGEEQVLAVA